MRTPAPWKGRILIGSGILITATLIALPRRGSSLPEPPSPVETPEPELTSTWFGHVSNGEALRLEGLDGEWASVGPLQLSEFSDGSARLSGRFQEGRKHTSSLWLEADLTGRPVDETGSVDGPGRYRAIEGFLRGAGEFEGGLIRLVSREKSASLEGDRLNFDWEWIETPTATDTGWSESRHGMSLQLEFGHSAPWGVQDFDFDLGSVPGHFEWMSGGQFVQYTDGRAELTAVIADDRHPDRAFQVELNWDEGDFEETSIHSFQRTQGRLIGLREFAGAEIELRGAGESFDVFSTDGEGNTLLDAFGEFVTQVNEWPQDCAVEAREGFTRGSLNFGLTSTKLRFAFASQATDRARDSKEYAFRLGSYGDDFVFESGGSFIESGRGHSTLRGIISRQSSPQFAFQVELRFEGQQSFENLVASPWYGLPSEVYSQNGGPVEPHHWSFFDSIEGRLSGLRDLAGTNLDLCASNTPFQMGFGANGRSLSNGAYSTFQMEPSPGEASEGEVEVALRTSRPTQGSLCFEFRSWKEDSIQVSSLDDGIWIDGIGNDFFFASGGRLRQESDGSARLTGVLQRQHFAGDRFFIDGRLGKRRDLHSDSVSFGSFEGELIGLDDFRGGSLSFSHGGAGTDLHLENGHFRLETTLRTELNSQPAGERRFRMRNGEAGLDITLRSRARVGAEESFALPVVHTPAGHALYLPGIGEDFSFPDQGSFEEFANGSACLEGRIVSASNPDRGFDLRIDFDQRALASDSSTASRLLPKSVYADRGGPVDPSLWHFYGRSRGILVGVGEFAGAVIELSSDREALQVGLGANDRNLEFGASGDFDLELLSQPIGGSAYLPEFYPGGEIHIDLPSTARE